MIITCNECYGEGSFSSCCCEYIDNGKCLLCGKFCKRDVCSKCEGYGKIEYNIGDDVEIFVCAYSSEYLKENLYQSKGYNDFKTFKGKIIKIIDSFHLLVKIKYYKKELKINIEDLEKI
jgi:hypothetical protein